MSREIRFRGIRIDNGELIYGNGVYINAENTFAFIVIDGGHDKGHRCYVDHKTVGQFTGLKDKNGVMIFEGDIVSHAKESNRTSKYTYVGSAVVIWDNYYGRYKLGEEDIWGMIYKSYEILGNIHENPELLK